MNLELVQYLIPLVVPLLVAGGKYLLPKVPGVLLPVVAILLGSGADLLAYAVGLKTDANPVVGAVLGGLGVVVRELVDQAKKLQSGG